MGLQQKYGSSSSGGAGTYFSSVVNSSAAAIAPALQSLTRIDLATVAADVIVALPAGAIAGQIVGVILTSDNSVNSVSFVNGPADALPLWTAGDWYHFAWDGAAWQSAAYDIAPGYLTDLGAGSLLANYRMISRTNYLTDYSGNVRTLSALGAIQNAPGYSVGKGAVKTSTGIGSSTSAGFRMAGAMSTMVHLFNYSNAFTSQNIIACGVPGAVGATNVQWSLGASAGGVLQYFIENGAGADVVFLGANAVSMPTGWTVIGMSRSAGQVVRFYYNGVLVDTSGVLAAPDGGASSNLGLGSYSTGGFPLLTSSLGQAAVWGVELTAAQMLRGARQIMGQRS